MFREPITVRNAGKWSRQVVFDEETQSSIVTVNPPGFLRYATYVCIQCGYEARE